VTQPEQSETPVAEAALTSMVLAALAAWLAPTLAAVMLPTLSGGMPNPQAMWSTSGIWTRWVDSRFMRVLTNLARPGWVRTMRDLDLDIPFDRKDPELLEILDQTRNLLVRVPDETYRQVVKVMADAVDKGESRAQIIARVDNILNTTGSENWSHRAAVIARTEINRFGEAGALAAGRRAERQTRRPLVKIWKDRDDTRVRGSHSRVDGQRRRLGEPFFVGRSMLQQPIDPSGFPEDVINCVPGSALIRGVDIEAVFRFQFEGPVLTLRGESGLSSTMSVNHPVVTELGWVRACEVEEGDHLLRAFGMNGRLGVSNPDPEGSDSTVEEIYDSLALAGMPHRVIALPVNFYGDVPAGPVDVVFTDGLLSVDIDSKSLQESRKLFLACSHLSNPPGSPEFERAKRVRGSSDSVMRCPSLSDPGLPAHVGPLEEFGFGLAPDANPSFPEAGSQDGSGDSLSVRELLEGFTTQVFLDKIVEIVRHDFSGHLYTLQTGSGIYIADNTVSHNCRCELEIKEA
jgi:hypothetical protein